MTRSPGDIEALHVQASDTRKRRSIRVLGWLVAAVIAA